jgi:acyl-CoA dehydrogenase
MTVDRGLLQSTVSRLFTKCMSRAVLETAERGVLPDALWRPLEEAGWTRPLAPVDGSPPATWEDVQLILRAAGYHAAPVPLAETILASWLLAGAAIAAPPGPLTVLPARVNERLELSQDGTSRRLSGVATRVPWGAIATHVVAVADVGGTQTVAIVNPGSYEVTRGFNMAMEPRDTLTFNGSRVSAAAPLARPFPPNVSTLYGAMARSAQMAGALEWMLESSVQHARTRRQFGKPIAAFQAIQHGLAVLAEESAAASVAAAGAARAADRAAIADPTFEIAVAKVRVGEAAGVTARLAHQIHGAMGFTREHALHLRTRRSWSWRAEFGSESHWSSVLGDAVMSSGADSLWSFLTVRS